MAQEYIGNPETAGLQRRSKYLEEAIKGLQATPKSQFDTATGTNANILSNAILAFADKGASEKAMSAQKADQDRLTNAILGTPEQANAAALTADAPMNLTPAGFEGRAQGVETDRLKAIAEMGGPMAALQYQMSQAATKRETDAANRAAQLERDKFGLDKFKVEGELNKPVVVDKALVDPNSHEAVYTGAPDPFTLGPGDQRFDGKGGQPVASVAPLPPKNGIDLTFGAGGALSGLSIGGSGTKGKEPAVIRGPDGQPVVSPGQQQLVANKSWNALQDYEKQNAIVLEDAKRALSKADGWTTGFMGSVFSGIPGSPQHDLANIINTVKANIGFDKLQSMRENSPTGGALGQVSENENKLLQSVMGALEQSQSPDQFKFHLTRLIDILSDKEGRRKAAFAQDYPELAQYAGFASKTRDQGRNLSVMSTEDLEQMLADLERQ